MHIIKIITHLTKANTPETTCVLFEKSLKIVLFFTKVKLKAYWIKDSHSSCAHHVLPGCQDNFLLLFLPGPCSITLCVLSQPHFKGHQSLYCTKSQKLNGTMDVPDAGHTLTHLWGSCCHGMKRSDLLVAGHYSSYITIR